MASITFSSNPSSFISGASDKSRGKAILQPLNADIEKLRQILIRTENAVVRGNALLATSSLQDIQKLKHDIARQIFKFKETLAVPEKELEKFGKKFLNLVKAHSIINLLGIPEVAVPLPQGLSTTQIEEYLAAQSPEVFELRKLLSEKLKNHTSSTPFLDDPNIASLREKIGTLIEKAFEHAAENDEAYKKLGISAEIEAWILKMDQEGHLIAIRSSGSEDGKKANAGGHLSTFTVPKRAAVCRDLGKVVASYFSYASMQNQINSGINPFEEPLQLAVAFQQFIGEADGVIPISLVLVSNRDSDDHRVMQISATPGLGTAVVGNEGINTDTILLRDSLAHPGKLDIQYHILRKQERLAAVNTPSGVVIQKLKNPVRMISEPALTNLQLVRLNHLAQVLELVFEGPIVMEIVMKGDIIHVVQTRPFDQKISANHLDIIRLSKLKKNPILESVQGEIAVVGHNSVMRIDNQSKIVRKAKTLLEAERKFKSDKHSLVIIEKEELSELTHPFINFTNLGIPCLHIPNQEKVEKICAAITPKTPLIVCVNTATLYLWDTSICPNPEEYVSPGFGTCPFKINISLPTSHLKAYGAADTIPPAVHQLMLEAQSSVTHSTALKKLSELRQHPWTTRIEKNQKDLHQLSSTAKFLPGRFKATTHILTTLDTTLQHAFRETIAGLQQVSHDDIMDETTRKRYLFNIKVIRMLMLGRTGKITGLSQYSIANTIPLADEAVRLIAYQNRLPFPIRFSWLLFLDQQAPIPVVSTEWEKFLIELEKIAEQIETGKDAPLSKNEIEQFENLILMLKTSQALPTWFAFYFKYDGKAENVVRSLLAEFPSGSTELLKEMETINEALRSNFAQLENFASSDDSIYSESLGSFFELLEPWHEEKSQTISKVKAASSLPKMFALHTMEELVRLFDEAGKKVLLNENFTPLVKVKKLNEMNLRILWVLGAWIKEFVYTGWESCADLDGSYYSVKGFLQESENHFFRVFYAKTIDTSLEPTAGFDVSQMLFSNTNSKARDMPYPKNTVETFTFLHQNLLTIIAYMYGKTMKARKIEDANLPADFKKMIKLIETQRFNPPQLPYRGRILTACLITKDLLTVRYHIRLGNHSLLLELQRDQTTHEMTLHSSFSGSAEGYRWQFIMRQALLSDHMGLLPLKNTIKISYGGLSFSCKVSEDNIAYALNQCEQHTYSTLAGKSVRYNDPLFWAGEYNKGCEIKGAEAVQRALLLNPLPYVQVPYDLYIEQMKSKEEGFTKEEAETLHTAIIYSSNIPLKKFLIGVCLDTNPSFEKEGIAPEYQGMLTKLVEKLKDDAMIFTITTANLLLESENPMSTEGLTLYNMLFDKGLAYDKAIQFIEQNFHRDDIIDLKTNCFKLLEELLKRGQHVPEAKKMCEHCIRESGIEKDRSQAKKALALVPNKKELFESKK